MKFFIIISIVYFCNIFFPNDMLSAQETTDIAYKSWQLRINSATGFWHELKHSGKVVSVNSKGLPSVNLLLENDQWLFSAEKIRFDKYELDQEKGNLKLKFTSDSWQLEEIIQFSPDGNDSRILRKVRFASMSDEPVKFYSLIFNFYLPEKGKYYIPGTFFYDNRSCWSDLSVSTQSAKMRQGEFSELPTNRALAPPSSVKNVLTELPGKFSQIYFVDTRKDGGKISLKRLQGLPVVEYTLDAAGWAEKGVFQEIGDAWLEVNDDEMEKTFEARFPQLLTDLQLTAPADRPEWVRDASIFGYELRSIKGNTFAEAHKLIPRIKELGFNTVWSFPVQQGRVSYDPEDYFKTDPGLGSWDEFRQLVGGFQKNNLRFLQDLVLHGGGLKAAQKRGESVFDMAFTEDGNVLSSWGMDFYNSRWQEYILKVARYYLDFGINGFRVDAPYGSFTYNWRRKGFPDKLPSYVHFWNLKKPIGKISKEWWEKSLADCGGEVPALEYARASLARSCGGLDILGKVLRETRLKNPDNALLVEYSGLPFTAISDMVYDLYFPHIISKFANLPHAEFVHRLSLWLEEQKLTDAPGTARMRYHYFDNDAQLKIQNFRGTAAAAALHSLPFVIDGVPMVFNANEFGFGTHIQRLNQLRDAIPELRRGEAFYHKLQSSIPEVFTVWRQMPDKSAISMINFSPDTVETEIAIPVDKLNFKQSTRYTLWEAYSGRKIKNGLITEFSKINLKLQAWETIILVWLPEETVPDWAAKAMPDKQEIRSGAPKLEGLTVSSPAYSLKINGENGLIDFFRNSTGQELLTGCDLLENPKIKPLPQVNITSECRAEEVRLTVDIHSCRIAYYCYPDRVEVKIEPKLNDVTLVLPLPEARKYQVDLVDGMLSDTVNLESASLKPNRSYSMRPRFRNRFTNNLIWSSLRQPLNLKRSELRFRTVTEDGLTIQTENGVYTAELYNSLVSSPGMHCLLASRELSPMKITLRPQADWLSDISAIPYQYGKLQIQKQAGDWVATNPFYRLKIQNNGGVINELINTRNGQKLLDRQDIILKSDQSTAKVSLDYETESEVITDEHGIRMVFHSEIRGAKLPPYPLYVKTEYHLDDSSIIRIDYTASTVGGGLINPALIWQMRDTAGKAVTIPWFAADFDRMASYRKYPLKITLDAGKAESLTGQADNEPLPNKISMELIGSRYSLRTRAMIPYQSLALRNTQYWIAKYGAYLDWDSKPVLKMSYPGPVFEQSLDDRMLEPGEYEVSFLLKATEVNLDIKLHVQLKYWTKKGKLETITKDLKFQKRDFDWSKQNVKFKIPAKCFTPIIELKSEINPQGVFVIDQINLQKISAR